MQPELKVMLFVQTLCFMMLAAEVHLPDRFASLSLIRLWTWLAVASWCAIVLLASGVINPG